MFLNFFVGRFADILDLCKSSENGDITDLSQLNEPMLARVVKYMLLKDRDNDIIRIQTKHGGRSETASATKTGKKSPPKSPKKAGSAKKVFENVVV